MRKLLRNRSPLFVLMMLSFAMASFAQVASRARAASVTE